MSQRVNKNPNPPAAPDPPGQSLMLPDRVLCAKNDKNELNRLILDYTPFLRALINKSINSYKYGADELLSIAMEAFWDAVRGYSPGRGAFIPFCSLVVRRTLFAYVKRQAVRSGREIPFSGMGNTDKDGKEEEYDPADPRDFTNPLKYEIDAIKDEAALYGIDFLQLAAHSPKADKTQEVCFEAVKIIARSAELTSKMRRSGSLPVQELAARLNVNRKVIERHRQYIVVAALIASDDYPYMQERIGLKGLRG